MTGLDGMRTSRRFLRRACLDILQRTPTPAEARTFVGAPVSMVVGRLMRSREAMEVWFEEELYYFLLLDNFRPKAELIDKVTTRLHEQKMSARDAIAEILLSTGFSLRNPGNDTFVSVVLEQCLGLTVQARENQRTLEAGKEMYDGRKAKVLGQHGSSQADFVRIVLEHEDFARHLVARHQSRLFGGDRELEHFTAPRVHEDPSAFFVGMGESIASDHYREALATKKPLNDRQFIRSLYMDLLGERPSYEQMRNMRNAMMSMADSTPIRAVMAKMILDSGQAELPELVQGGEKDFVTRCFERYLGRPPGQEELPAFVEQARQPDCTAGHIVRALVGSTEYQYY